MPVLDGDKCGGVPPGVWSKGLPLCPGTWTTPAMCHTVICYASQVFPQTIETGEVSSDGNSQTQIVVSTRPGKDFWYPVCPEQLVQSLRNCAHISGCQGLISGQHFPSTEGHGYPGLLFPSGGKPNGAFRLRDPVGEGLWAMLEFHWLSPKPPAMVGDVAQS